MTHSNNTAGPRSLTRTFLLAICLGWVAAAAGATGTATGVTALAPPALQADSAPRSEHTTSVRDCAICARLRRTAAPR